MGEVGQEPSVPSKMMQAVEGQQYFAHRNFVAARWTSGGIGFAPPPKNELEAEGKHLCSRFQVISSLEPMELS